MSRFCSHAEDFCGLACASAEACTVAAHALEGDAQRVHAASLELVKEALDALESCSRHGCSAHQNDDDARRLLEERPCALCRTYVCEDALTDVSELVAFAGLVCEDCEHVLIAEQHDDEACECTSCNRARSQDERKRREAEAAHCGGLSPAGLRLVLSQQDIEGPGLVKTRVDMGTQKRGAE